MKPSGSESRPVILGRFFRRARRLLLGWRGRVRISQEAWHLALAGIVGLIGGGTNLIFITLLDWLSTWPELWLSDQGDSASSGWKILTLTTGGGLIAGLVLYLGLHYVRRKGDSGFLEAVVLGDGRLSFRTALIKGISSLSSIASGAAIGQEGSITQLTATVSSKWGQLFRWPPYRLRLLVACGTASGMAAAYHAPIAGAVFAAQVVLGNFAMNLFAPLVFSSVIAAMVSRSFFGMEPLYSVPSFAFVNDQLPWFLLLGVLCGFGAVVFQQSIKCTEFLYEKMRFPIYLRLALGGLILGFLALSHPGVMGNGYQEASQALQGDLTSQQLLYLSLARLVATVFVVGAGTLGGILTPTLFLGAGLGGLYYYGVAYLFETPALPVGAFALVGMGGLLAGTTHAPLLAMIMMLELTLDYTLMPPLMLTCVVATLIARTLHRPNIYSERLELKGLATPWETEDIGTASRRRIGDLMLEPIPPVKENVSFDHISERFLTCAHDHLPVVERRGRLVGIVVLQDLKEHLTKGDQLLSVIALDVMRPPPAVLTPDQRLEEALSTLLSSEANHIHVVNNRRDMKLIGVLVRSEVLGLLSEAIAPRSALSSQT